jgi:hypothetical protein
MDRCAQMLAPHRAVARQVVALDGRPEQFRVLPVQHVAGPLGGRSAARRGTAGEGSPQLVRELTVERRAGIRA